MSILDAATLAAIVGLVVLRVELPFFGMCLYCSGMKRLFPDQV